MILKVYDTSAKEVGEIEVSEDVFGAELNTSAIHQVVVAQLANKRQGTKATLSRSEVRGGGIKPWRQKGTGRARQGSIRSPQWKGGGVVFAHKPRDFSKKINKKLKTLALRSALSEKIRAGEFIVLDKVELKEAKTKLVAAILKNFGIDKKAMLVLDSYNNDILVASRNIPFLKTGEAELLNVYDLVSCGKVLITSDAVKKIEEAYAL
ncbi:MAG: 50S ribosomal protein L4 [Christensenellales bacterium]|jgi:large subunit ribosomal protein L4